jgi:hypothetical protein
MVRRVSSKNQKGCRNNWQGQSADSRIQERSIGTAARHRFEDIEFLGQDFVANLPLLLIFFEIGKEFQSGASSIRKVSSALEARSFAGTLRDKIPPSCAAVSRSCKEIRIYFANKLNLSGEAPLFDYLGRGWSVSGLTELGQEAWEWVRVNLLALKIIAETS